MRSEQGVKVQKQSEVKRGGASEARKEGREIIPTNYGTRLDRRGVGRKYDTLGYIRATRPRNSVEGCSVNHTGRQTLLK